MLYQAFQEIHCQQNVGGRIGTHLTLDGEEAVVADLLQGGKVVREIDVALSERHFHEVIVDKQPLNPADRKA